jgi:pimeloyl-ACP methyl ester carboxylesterase
MTEMSDIFDRKSKLSPAKRALHEKRLRDASHLHTSVYEEVIQPFYFGTSEKPLFGCYHTQSSGPTRDCGAVLCAPLGEEYIRFHRVYRQLAFRLSSLGFPVLRFDFYGCGDSSGNCQQWQISHWLADISTAIGEIRRRSGVMKVCLIGLRLGGTLSMMAGDARGDIDGMVLWDAVVSGRAYVEELTASHQEMLRKAHVKPKPRMADEKQTEILGFPLTDSMLTDLEKVDLLAIQQRPANNILVIESNEKASQERLMEHLKRMDASVEYQHRPNPQFWVWIEDYGRVLAPQQILQSVVSWISEVYS